MLHILLLIVKIIGIILAVITGLLLTALLLVLFVPVRYRIKAEGNLDDKETLRAEIRITWLLHIVNIMFSYPKAACIRARIFCFTVFNSSQPEKPVKEKKAAKEKKVKKKKIHGTSEETSVNERGAGTNGRDADSGKEDTGTDDTGAGNEAALTEKENMPHTAQEPAGQKEEKDGPVKTFPARIRKLFKKPMEIIRNIRYTINAFCDRIKKIIEKISFYTEILQSDTCKRAFDVSKKQLLRILRNVCPKKCDIRLTLGTGDPAGAGQLLAIYGMAYPFIGQSVSVQADFENKIVEGSLYIKGRITVFTLLVAAFTIYRDRNIRQLLKLLKREES